MGDRRREWSWAATEEEAVAFRAEANRLVGCVIAEVRYITLDYRSDIFRGAVVGPRVVSSGDEWVEPFWHHPVGDTVDFAVEFRTETDRAFTVSWESPGTREGLGLREVSAVGSALTLEANATIWDVSDTVRWRDLVGGRVDSVELCYEPWDGTGALWCRQIDLVIGACPISLLLAEVSWVSGGLDLAADNIVVVTGDQVSAPWRPGGR